MRVLPNERAAPAEPAGKPLPDSKIEQPTVIRRAEVVAFALVALLIICIVAVLYAAKAFFLPVLMAFVVGTVSQTATELWVRSLDSMTARKLDDAGGALLYRQPPFTHNGRNNSAQRYGPVVR